MTFFDDLRAANLARVARWHPAGLSSWSVMQWACAMAGEAGEACNVAKKIQRAVDGVGGKTATAAELADELADTIIYADLLAASQGIDLRRAIIRKFNAVSIREGMPDRLKYDPRLDGCPQCGERHPPDGMCV